MSDDEQEAVLANKKRRKVSRNEFIDDEAELSGDDVGSEDEEEPSDDDQLLEDLVDKDAAELDSDQEEEVRGLYHKQIDSEDKRALLLLKEKLEDNNVFYGQQRRRKYRWQTRELIDNNLGRHGDPDDDDSQDYESDDIDDNYDDLKPRLRRPGANTLMIGSTKITTIHIEDDVANSRCSNEPQAGPSTLVGDDSNSNAIMPKITSSAAAKAPSSDINRFLFRDRELVEALSTKETVIVSREDKDRLVQRELRRVLQSKSIFDQLYT